jgi:hypothetical protein
VKVLRLAAQALLELLVQAQPEHQVLQVVKAQLGQSVLQVPLEILELRVQLVYKVQLVI